MAVTRIERRARRLFGAVLHLYPASYRDEYGREMTLVLVDRLRGERNATAQVVVLFAAIAAVFADAPKQHAFVLAQDLRGLLFGIEPWDPLSQTATIVALGLGRPNYVAVHNDTPAIRGMIQKVQHLVEVKEVQ